MESCKDCQTWGLYPEHPDLKEEVHRLFCTQEIKYKGWDQISSGWDMGKEKEIFCGFCKQNGQSPHVYMSHKLKDEITEIVTCPVLRTHVCEFCGETGDTAHTKSYCPLHPGLHNIVVLTKTARCAIGFRKPRA